MLTSTLPQPKSASNYYRLIIYAQEKLMIFDLPMQLRAVCYVRTCCSVIQKFAQLRQISHFSYPDTATNGEAQLSYLTLLDRLLQTDLDWWATCYISSDRLLQSTNPKVQKLLQPLNAFVQGMHQPPLTL